MIRFAPFALIAIAAPTAAYAADTPATVPIAGTKLQVVATGEVDRVPDLATISAGVVTQASSAGKALSDNAQRMTATIAAIRRAGVADRDIRTSSIRLNPQYRYAENQPPVITGYQATNQVTVRLRDVKAAGGVLDALVAAGANQIEGPNLSIDKPEAALDEARTAAIATARARADLYARAAGLSVRRIVAISEGEGGGGRPMGDIVVTAMRAAKAPSPIEAGEQTLSVSVTVVFELG